MSFTLDSVASCPSCRRETGNVCVRCGCLKATGLPPRPLEVKSSRPVQGVPWKMFHLAMILSTISGILIGIAL